MTEPFTDHAVADATRLIVAAGALWLAAMVLKLAWYRRNDVSAAARPSLLTYVSFALALLLIGATRAERLGAAPRWTLWMSVVVVVLGIIGVLRRVRVTFRPPWRRPQ